jgi:hypothetical protein
MKLSIFIQGNKETSSSAISNEGLSQEVTSQNSQTNPNAGVSVEVCLAINFIKDPVCCN